MEWIAALLAACIIGWLYYRFTGPMIKISLVIVAMLVTAYAYFLWDEFSKKKMISSVITKGRLDRQCEYPYSLLVVSKNGTRKTIIKRRIRITGYREGYSDVVFSGDHISDKIINPGEVWAECISTPGKAYGYVGKLPNYRDAQWKIHLYDADFK